MGFLNFLKKAGGGIFKTIKMGVHKANQAVQGAVNVFKILGKIPVVGKLILGAEKKIGDFGGSFSLNSGRESLNILDKTFSGNG